jgi:hypothetical protein
VVVGEPDDALDRLEVVRGTELGQKRNVAGLGGVGVGVGEGQVLKWFARGA